MRSKVWKPQASTTCCARKKVRKDARQAQKWYVDELGECGKWSCQWEGVRWWCIRVITLRIEIAVPLIEIPQQRRCIHLRVKLYPTYSSRQAILCPAHRIYLWSRAKSPSKPFVVAPSAISFSFFRFLVLSNSQHEPYKKPATTVNPAETAFPWMYRGPCCVGYNCDDTKLERLPIESASGIPKARLSSGANVPAIQVTARVEVG